MVVSCGVGDEGCVVVARALVVKVVTAIVK